MKNHIWIASHFHNTTRYKLFQETIKSICSQTLKPDLVVLSYSVQHDIQLDVETLFHQHLTPAGIQFLILQQPERLLQFQHLKKIHDHFLLRKEEDIIVSFCDDDDMCHKERLEYVCLAMGEHKNNVVSCFYYLIDDDIMFEKEIKGTLVNKSDFGCYSCFFHILTEFFETSYGIDVNKNTDVFFMSWCCGDVCLIDKPLYYKRNLIFQYNMHIWNVPLEKTNSDVFHTLIDLIGYYIKSIKDGNRLFVIETDNKKYKLNDKHEIKNFLIDRWFDIKEDIDPSLFLEQQKQFICFESR